MPSTFTGSVGKVVYLLEGRLSRSMRISTKDKTKLTFVSRTNMNPDPELMVLVRSSLLIFLVSHLVVEMVTIDYDAA